MDDEQGSNGSAFEEAKAAARSDYAGKTLRGLVDAMNIQRIEKERLEALLRDCNAAYDVLRFELVPDKMESEGVERVSYEGIGRVSLTGDIRVAMKEKQGLFDWLHKRKLADLITPTINSSTLKAFVKGRMQRGEEVPSEFLNVTPITRASITKG